MIEGDIKIINLRVMDNAIVVLPPKYDDIDIIYQYLTNKELSVIATTVLSHVNEAHLL